MSRTYPGNDPTEIRFACPRCLERQARELESQGLSLVEIASMMNVTLRAIVLMLEASEAGAARFSCCPPPSARSVESHDVRTG